jgi:hypothetical protein
MIEDNACAERAWLVFPRRGDMPITLENAGPPIVAY